MTNLMRWLMYICLFAAPYFAIISGSIQSPVLNKWMLVIKILPIILIVLFGIYAVTIVLYRTLTIKDCPEAERELRDQIKEATEDLKKKGLKIQN